MPESEQSTEEARLKCPAHLSDPPTVHFEKRGGKLYWVCDAFGMVPKHHGIVNPKE